MSLYALMHREKKTFMYFEVKADAYMEPYNDGDGEFATCSKSYYLNDDFGDCVYVVTDRSVLEDILTRPLDKFHTRYSDGNYPNLPSAFMPTDWEIVELASKTI